jgi:prepilin peptidase CpaA
MERCSCCAGAGDVRRDVVIVSTIAIMLFPLLMAFAASADLLTMRISNGLVLMIAGAFLVLAVVTMMPLDQIAWHLISAASVLVVAFAFFAFGWIGGGDAKLAAAVTLWTGFGLMLPYLIYAALLGGALTMAIIAVRRFPLPGQLARIKWIDRLHDAKSGVPYGIALAAAGILVYSDTTIFQHFVA